MDPKELAKQLRQPEGEAGIVVGKKMNEGNARMYELTYSMMHIADQDRILEIGFGNGRLIPEIISKAKNIFYSGIDFSDTMVEEARLFNNSLLSEGKVEILKATVSAIPFKKESFNKVFTINTLYFWPNPAEDIKEIYRVVKKGGSLCISIRPKSNMDNLEFTRYGFTKYEFEEVKQLMEGAGFQNITHEVRDEPPFEMNGMKIQFQGMCIQGIK